MNICFCIDENYVNYLGAVLLSLVESNGHNRVNIFVIHNGLTNESISKLSNAITTSSLFAINFVNSVDSNVSRLQAGGHISSATYIRFEIPSLLLDIDKVIYLDADLIVCDDLTDFWQLDISDKFVAATDNPFFDRNESICLKNEAGYFNAGVLLINTKLWRDFSVKEKALEFLSLFKEQAIMFDQDALNYVFNGCWLKAGIRWNLQTSFLRRYKELDTYSAEEVRQAYLLPAIVHYSSSSKPWNFLDVHPFRGVFLGYLYKFGGKLKKPGLVKYPKFFLKWIFLSYIFNVQLRNQIK